MTASERKDREFAMQYGYESQRADERWAGLLASRTVVLHLGMSDLHAKLGVELNQVLRLT